MPTLVHSYTFLYIHRVCYDNNIDTNTITNTNNKLPYRPYRPYQVVMSISIIQIHIHIGAEFEMVPVLALGPTTHIVEQTSRLCQIAGFGAFQARSLWIWPAFTSGNGKYDCRPEIYGCTTSPSVLLGFYQFDLSLWKGCC